MTRCVLARSRFPDYLAMRFRERIPIIRLMSVIVIMVAMMLYCAAQFAAAGKAFSASFDGLSYQWGVLIGAAIVLTYVTLGGFRAACWTDMLQGLLMVGVLVIFPLWLLMSGNGVDMITSGLAKGGDELLTFWPQATGVCLGGRAVWVQVRLVNQFRLSRGSRMCLFVSWRFEVVVKRSQRV